MKISISILLLQAVLAGALVNDAYYGEEFIRFQQMLRPKNVFLQSIFKEIDFFNSTSNKCIMHMKKYKESLFQNNETWVEVYQDSSGGLGPSILSGSTVNLGDFDQCVAQTTPQFGSNYCWLKVELAGERSSRLPSYTPLVFSICVPDSCRSEQLEQLVNTNSALKHNFTITVHCQSARPTFTPVDIFFMALFSCIAVATLSTMIPKEWIPISNQVILDIWQSFNLNRNLRALQSKSNREILRSLHAIRFLSQSLLIWYHMLIVCLVGNYPIKNKFFFNELFRSWTGTAETELVLNVDTFFMMSGLLLTYNCLKRKTDINLIKYYIHRYLRLTPPFAACVIILATFGNKFCTGPLCNVTIDKEQEACKTHWWANLLYINNFYPGLLKSCMPHTWYLSADWQLFMFVSPIVVIVINKWPQHIHKLVAGIFLSSIISTFIVSFVYEIPTDTVLFSSSTVAENYYNKMYASPHSRAGPWAIGMFLGVLLHNHKNTPITLPKWAVMSCWIGSGVVLCCSVEANLPFLRGSVDPKSFLNALLITGQRNVFALAVSWIIFATNANIAGPVGMFLSWRVFEPLGKLSYSTYLIHKLIVNLYAGETRSPIYYSTSSQLPPILGVIVLSYAAGLLLYLTFEAPTVHLEKILFQKRNSNNGSTNTQQSHVTNINELHKRSEFSANTIQLKDH